MGFLKKLLGGKKEGAGRSAAYNDPDGIYFYAECNRCHTCVRVRADRRHDLNDADGGYVWHKTIVDSRCFQRMQAVVRFDRGYNILSAEIEGGRFVTEADYNAFLETKAQITSAGAAPTADNSSTLTAAAPDADRQQNED